MESFLFCFALSLAAVFRLINSLVSAFVYSSYVDERGLLVCTKIVRLPKHGWSSEPWDCYFYEIRENELQSGRDLSFRIKRSASDWSTHYFRPFYLDRESARNLDVLVAGRAVARWRTFYDAGSVVFSALVFSQDQETPATSAVTGCSVYTFLPAPRYQLQPSLNYVGTPPPPSDPNCSVRHCLVCTPCTNMTPFDDGSFLSRRAAAVATTHTLTSGFASSFMASVMDRAYTGDIFAYSKTRDVFYLVVEPLFAVRDYGSIRLTDRELNLHFTPIPEPHPNSELYVYFQLARLADYWVGFGSHVDFQLLPRSTAPRLIHFARNLVLRLFERNDSSPPASEEDETPSLGASV